MIETLVLELEKLYLELECFHQDHGNLLDIYKSESLSSSYNSLQAKIKAKEKVIRLLSKGS